MSKIYVDEIRPKTSGNQVLFPEKPAFTAWRTAGSVSPTNYVVYDSVQTNVGNHYNSSTGRFTAPVTGTYLFTVHALASTGATAIEVALRINESTMVANARNASGSVVTSSATISQVVTLTAGQYVSVRVEGSGSIFGQGAYDSFSGFLIG